MRPEQERGRPGEGDLSETSPDGISQHDSSGPLDAPECERPVSLRRSCRACGASCDPDAICDHVLVSTPGGVVLVELAGEGGLTDAREIQRWTFLGGAR